MEVWVHLEVDWESCRVVGVYDSEAAADLAAKQAREADLASARRPGYVPYGQSVDGPFTLESLKEVSRDL